MINRIKCWLYGHDLDFKILINYFSTDCNGNNKVIIATRCFCRKCKRFVRI